MKHRLIPFQAWWAIASFAIGVIATFASNVGAGRPVDIEFLASGGIIGFCIYLANIILHGILAPQLDRWPASISAAARVALSIVGGLAGWIFGYALVVLVTTGQLAMPPFEGRNRWFLIVALAITIMVGVLAHGYHELRLRLSESIEREKEGQFAEKELELAREIQSRLLPPSSIEGDGFRVTARNLPAHFVAGDFYDVLRHEDGSVGIVIADVSGKGVGASLIMASVKAMLPFVANGSVADTLQKLNERLASQLGRREFVALAYARFQPATGKLRFANAGMPDPYLLSGGSATPISMSGARLPLGVRDDIAYDSIEVQLGPGDRFLLISDGLPEAPRSEGEPLGYDALRQIILGIPPGDDWIDSLLERVRAQVQSVDDDWTAVVLERRSTQMKIAASP